MCDKVQLIFIFHNLIDIDSFEDKVPLRHSNRQIPLLFTVYSRSIYIWAQKNLFW